MFHIGIAAGLGTACSWAISSTIHSAVSRIMGVHSFMMIRQPLAVLVLLLACVWGGQFQMCSMNALIMALFSGLVGIALCDWCLYESILRIGIRPALVCHSLYACCTAMMGVFFLGESLGLQGSLGIAVATCGVILVILAERGHDHLKPGDVRRQKVGVGLALFSAVAVAFAFIASKAALQEGMTPLFLTLLRNVAASVALWSVALGLHKVRSTMNTLRTQPRVIKLLLWGCIFGPSGGIWLSCVALEHAPAAVASTLIGLQPVALLLVSGIAERRCPSLGSILGSCTACGGAAILLLR